MADSFLPRPVFVVGASRSGTALMRSALNRSSTVFIAGETHYFDDLRPRLGDQATSKLDESSRRLCEDYFLALSHRPYGHGGEASRGRLDRVALRRAALAAGGSGDAYFEAYCALARALESEVAGSPVRWGEKTPRHIFRLTEMLVRYPGGQAICMYRDPRGVVASYGNWQHQGGIDLAHDEGYADALEQEEQRAKASFDPSIISLLWRATLRAGVKARQIFGDSRVKLIRYEDVVSDPTGTLQDIMNWLGLPFEVAMLNVPMHNSSFSHFQSESGVSTAPVERWRSTLSAVDIAIVQRWCHGGLNQLGYPLVEIDVGPVARARTVVALPVAAVRATWVNRGRAGRLPTYVWRRLKLMRAS